MDDYNTGTIKIKKVLIFIVIVGAILGLTLWGGTSIGRSQATTDAEALTENISQTQDQLSQMTSMSTKLQTQLTSAQDDYSQLQTQYAALQNENAALQSQLTAAQQNLSALQTQLAAAQLNLTNLQAQVANSQQSNSALQTQLASAQQNVTSLQTQLTTAQQNIGSLQDQLADWYRKWYELSHSVPSSPSLAINPASGPAGTAATVSGSGFIAGSSGVVFFDVNNNGVLDAGEANQTVAVSSSGIFTVTLAVPTVSAGSYQIMAALPAGTTPLASVSFTVTAH